MNTHVSLFPDYHFSFLSQMGLTSTFFAVKTGTIIATWAVIMCIACIIRITRYCLRYKDSKVRFVALTWTHYFMDLCTQTLHHFSYRHFSFIAALFIFIFMCNCINILPYLEEPTADLNSTLALGITSFLYVNFFAIKTHGIVGYLKEFLQPIFVMLPIHIIGKISSIISISFRLFGNIMGGSIISSLYLSLVGSAWYWMIPHFMGLGLIITLFFGIFEGLIQAFVFSMLSLTYLSMGIQQEEGVDHV